MKVFCLLVNMGYEVGKAEQLEAEKESRDLESLNVGKCLLYLEDSRTGRRGQLLE
jgi:hypothetical protein